MKKRSDHEYFGELLRVAQLGNRTAFAELYAATYNQTYRYAVRFLKDQTVAKDALRNIYAEVLREIQGLRTPELFMTWLNRISFQVCYEMQRRQEGEEDPDEMVLIDGRRYSLKQVLRLPLTESQVLIGYYYQKLSIRANAKNLDISRSEVKRNLHLGRIHLKKLLGDM